MNRCRVFFSPDPQQSPNGTTGKKVMDDKIPTYHRKARYDTRGYNKNCRFLLPYPQQPTKKATGKKVVDNGATAVTSGTQNSRPARRFTHQRLLVGTPCSDVAYLLNWVKMLGEYCCCILSF